MIQMFKIKLAQIKKSLFFKIFSFLIFFFFLDFIISAFLLRGLNKYYGLSEKSEIAFVGHSHLMLGIDKEMIEKEIGVKVAKYTREGVNVSDRKKMIEQLLKENKGLKTVIYGVDAWSFSGEGLSENSFKLFYPFMNNEIIDKYIYKESAIEDYLTKKYIRLTRYNEQLLGGAIRGYLGKWDNLKFGNVDVDRLEKQISNNTYRKINNDEENIRVFKESIVLLLAKNINIVFLQLPTIDVLTDVQERKYNETIEIIKGISNKYDTIYFLNFQEPWSHNHKIFYDPIHLNPYGQELLTKELINYLKKNEERVY